MSQKISTGIDIGSSYIKVIVAELSKNEENNKPKIIGSSLVPTSGMRHGYITDLNEVGMCLKKAISLAEKSSGYHIEKAYFSIGGAGLYGFTNIGTSVFEKESTISQNDINQSAEQAEREIAEEILRNKEIIHSIPLSFKIDDAPVYGKPQGMIGSKIESKVFFVTSPSQQLENLLTVARMVGITVEDVVASPIASSIALLSRSQQIAGCALVIIGSETVALAIFENGVPVAVDVLPIGSSDITNDIALGFKVSLEEAERIKTSRPEVLPYPRKKIEEIVKARLEDMYDFVQSVLKKNGKQGLLPAGILITGGGALSNYSEELAKEKLKLPAKKIGIKFDGESKVSVADGLWSVAYGLAFIGIESGENSGRGWDINGRVDRTRGAIEKLFKNIGKLFKKILP